jgi:hypothetical protein
MDWKKCELHYLDVENLAQQGIDVPAVQPYSFVGSSHTNVDGEMRNGLDVKSDRGSPVFKVKAIFEENGTVILLLLSSLNLIG